MRDAVAIAAAIVVVVVVAVVVLPRYDVDIRYSHAKSIYIPIGK